MKRIIAIVLLACATVAFGQEKKDEDYNVTREFKNKIFEMQNRDPRDIYTAVRLLGSGFKGSAISFNEETHTMTVRDFPENIAANGDAITRLDKPGPAEADDVREARLADCARTLGCARGYSRNVGPRRAESLRAQGQSSPRGRSQERVVWGQALQRGATGTAGT